MLRSILAVLFAFVLPSFERSRAAEDPVAWTGVVELPGGTKLEFSVALTKDSGTITIPVQRAKDLPLTDVVVTDQELKFGIRSAGAAWEMKVAADGKTAEGVLKQGGEFKTTMKRLAAGEAPLKEVNRPQEPKPPFPYLSLEVRFEDRPARVTLAGTLSVPMGDGPFPCVVMVTGSGAQDRDEALMGHRPFFVIADYLTRHGIAVLRYDDRGFGKSTGKFAGSTSDDFAEDAFSAVQFLKLRKEVDPRKIGMIGHSEGGVIAPMVAANSKDVAFIVLLAGTGMTGAELLPLQSKLIGMAAGVPAAEAEIQAQEAAKFYALMLAEKSDAELKESIRATALRQLKAAPETKDLSEEELKKKADAVVAEQAGEVLSPWFKRFVRLDPRQYLKKVTCPVLAVNGEKDLQVPPKENLASIEKTLKDAGNKDVTVIEFPGLNHLFQTCKTGSPSEYGTIEETFSPTALEAVTKWIRKRAGLE